ncbi:MAG: hypothetical protein ACK5R0_06720 [Bacteroidota bacterium]
MEEHPEKNQSAELQVWVNPDATFEGVGIKTLNNEGPWFTDPQGEYLGMHWLEGSGVDLNVINGEWGSYMRANVHIDNILRDVVDNDVATRTQSGGFSKTIFATTGVNDRTSGYGMLHGTTNFNILMNVTVLSPTQLQYSAVLTWNDRINPNLNQGDGPYATVSGWFYTPKDYDVRIIWTQNYDVTRK